MFRAVTGSKRWRRALKTSTSTSRPMFSATLIGPERGQSRSVGPMALVRRSVKAHHRDEVIRMNGLMKTESKPTDLFDKFDRMFEDWTHSRPIARFFGREGSDVEMIRVDEFRENGNLVIRAELPGIDPDKDVDLTVSDGVLHIEAHRREEESKEEKGYTRRELRYGSFMRMLPLPEGTSESDVSATYQDGILEIKVPAPTPAAAPEKATKVAITKS